MALYVVGWGCGWFLFWRARPLPPASGGGARSRPRLAVIVPARNEQQSLPELLSTVVPQLAADDWCIVVDDESSDATAEVASRAGVEVVAAPPRPEGWTGKAWACATGARRAAEAGVDVLVFLDADVRMDRAGVLDRVVAEVEANPPSLVSVQPWHRTGRPVEQLSLFFNVTALMGSSAFTALGTHVRPGLAFGPVLACRRTAYEAVGGHGHPAVRGAVAEDIALGSRFASVQLHTGHPDISFRMYPDGLRSLVEGWTKNIATGAAHVRWWFMVMVVGWLWSLSGGWLTSPWFYVASVIQVAVLGRRAGRFGVLATLAYPALVVIFLVVFLRSVVLTALRRPVRWKGRTIPIRAAR